MDPFLHRLLTCDETWVLYNNEERKSYWLDRDEPAPSVPRVGPHPRRHLLTVWWCVHGIVHYELLREGTITADFYSQQLLRVELEIRENFQALLNSGKIVLLHDNARPHIARTTRDTVDSLGWEILPHPPYSPDISPCDFHLFRSMKHYFRGLDHQSYEELVASLKSFFETKMLLFSTLAL